MLSLIITRCTLVCNITTPTLVAILVLYWWSLITNESNEVSVHEPKMRKRDQKRRLGDHGLRRLGVPGLELNAEPILYGVDVPLVPLLILGSLDNPK